MLAGSIDSRLKLEQLFWFGVIGLSTLVVGYSLASNMWLLAFGTIGFIGLILLPYHSKLSVYLSIATFNSAIIVPLFPGRLYMWEFAALLGWTGLIITICTRSYSPNFMREIKENRWLYVGLIGYVTVLIVTVFIRGFGLRILGSEQMGGRYYFQQMACGIFPFLFVMLRLNEKVLVKLYVLQCLLTITFLFSDFILALAPEGFYFILQFFELSGDAVNFELQASRFGIRRYQSFFTVGSGLFCLLFVFFKLQDFLSKKALLLIPVLALILGVGLLSGHRYLGVIVVGVVLVAAYAQRFFVVQNIIMGTLALLLSLFIVYGYANQMPLALQRALSVMPMISVDPQAKMDGDATLDTRRILRRIGSEMIPQYFWAGRGFGLATEDYSWQWDPTVITSHVNQGRFFNGFIGLMVNTGVFGTFFMLLFLAGGTWLSWRVVQHVRQYGSDDPFSRMCIVLAGLYVSNTLAFLFLHGDSEYALKTFSLQAGMLLACHIQLRRRLEQSDTENNQAPTLIKFGD